jgi:HAD superfamily hydrolase (TIGR01509 family)
MAGELRRPPFRVSHIFLDIDGTLADYNEATVRAALDAAVVYCRAFAGEDITPRELVLARDAVEHDPAWATAPTTLQRREAVRRVLRSHGTVSDETIPAIMTAYEEARDLAMPLFPDALPALDALRALAIPLTAASNGDFDLGRLGLVEYFAGTHYAVDAGVTKPDRRFFTDALARVGVTPDAALFVGDRLDNDYVPARAVGMHAVLVDREGARRAQPLDASILRIASLTELPPMVERA